MSEHTYKPDLDQDDGQIVWGKRLFWLLSLLTILRIFLSLYLDLTPDESYYWQLSRHPDFSYFDHPPMVAWLIALLGYLPGESQLYIRIIAVFSAAATSYLLFLVARDFLHSAKTGFWAAVILNFNPAGTALGFITTPDTPLAFAWAFAMFSFLKAINDTRDRWWLATGIALGFGALSKYNMIFFVPGIAIVILAFKKYRHLVFTRRYWLMVGLAALGTLPIIYWNINHDWISFKFQFAHGLTPRDYGILRNFGEFLGGQLATVGLILFPLLYFVAFTTATTSWRKQDETRFFLAWLALPTMLFFAYSGLRSKVEANWPQVAYLSVMLLAAEWACRAPNPSRRLKWVILPSALMAGIAIIQSLTLALPLPGKSDVTMRMHGWQQLGEIVRRADQASGKKATFVVQGATLATLVSYYGKIESQRIAELYSTGNFRVWWQDRQLEPGTNVIYIDENRHSEAAHHAEKFAASSCESHDIYACGRKIRTINVTQMVDLQEPFTFIHPNEKTK